MYARTYVRCYSVAKCWYFCSHDKQVRDKPRLLAIQFVRRKSSIPKCEIVFEKSAKVSVKVQKLVENDN